MAAEWQSLVSKTIKDYAEQVLLPQIEQRRRLFHLLGGRRTPEEIAIWEREMEVVRQREASRIAAIEAAKTPAQRLKEKQERCDHQFTRRSRIVNHHVRWIKAKCKICGKEVSKSFAEGYTEGRYAGYEAGQQSVDCDC